MAERTGELRIEAIVSQYEMALIRYVARILHDANLAEDVVQETFLKLSRIRPDCVPENLRAWLYAVARNCALDILRREKRVAYSSELVDSAMEKKADPANAESRGRQILNEIQNLSSEEQEALRLKFEEELSYSEISQVMELTVPQVGHLLHSGLKTLRQRLNPQGGTVSILQEAGE